MLDPNGVYTTAETLAWLKTSRRRLTAWRAAGLIAPISNYGASVRFRGSEIIACLDRLAVVPPAAPAVSDDRSPPALRIAR